MIGVEMDAQAFREAFPVLGQRSYLNAGTCGPLPAAAADAVARRLAHDLESGRSGRDYFETVMALAQRLREAYAAVLGAEPEEVALTGSTTDGVNTVIGGLRFERGDEILTSDEEHPGLLGPLRLARERHGVKIRLAPFATLAEHVSSETRLIACSHVSWVGGKVADLAAIRATGVPFLLDGAQGLGAVPVDVRSIGCDYYAASGQKWMCGPEGSGCLFVSASALDRVQPPWPAYGTFADHDRPLDSELTPGATRLDHGFPSAVRNSWALASLEVLDSAGWDWVHTRAITLAGALASALAGRGLDVAPRNRSTLVSWRVADPDSEVLRLAARGFVIRSIPSGGLVRASVGAWSSESELERLAELASTPG